MTDAAPVVRELLGRGSIYTVALGIQLAASLVTVPVATRLLPPSEYGVIALSITVAGVVTAISVCGLQSVVARIYFDEDDGPSASRRLILPGGILAMIGAVIASSTSPIWVSALGSARHGLALNIAVWGTVPAVIVALCESYLRAAERAVMFVVIAVLAGVVGQFIGVGLVAIVPGAGADEYVAGIAAGLILAAIFGLLVVRPWHDGILDREAMRASLALGAPLIPWGLAWLLLALGDRVVIQRLDGANSVGRYQIAYTLGALSLTLVSTVASAWTPLVFGAAEERRWKVHSETLAAIQTLAALVAAGLALGGPVLLLIATPASYREPQLAAVVAFVAVAAFPWAMYGSHAQILLWHKKTKALGWITPVSAAANLALVAALLPLLGLAGAGLATLLAYSLLAILSGRAARTLVTTEVLGRPVFLAWAGCLIVAAIGAAVPVDGAWIGARVILTAMIAVVFGLAVRRLIARPALEPAPPPASDGATAVELQLTQRAT